MNIQVDKSLKAYNTFGIDVTAAQFIAVSSVDELRAVVDKQKSLFILGGGSNMLLVDDIAQLVVQLNIKGIQIVDQTSDHVIVDVSAGENWHEFVLWCLERNYGGLENLSLIPGNVGTAPIQNIGAYGVELKDRMVSLEALHIATNTIHTFSNADCKFGYRNSIFKEESKGEFIIISVRFKLTKKNHVLNSAYGAINTELSFMGIKDPSIQDIAKAVIRIRQQKLPDPKVLGNSGSFFKNPIISMEQFEQLVSTHPDIPHYPVSSTTVKVPAGWLVEQCGFKGQRFGDAGVHKKQALVLVNYGQAKGHEILALAKNIQAAVKEKFGIPIEAEVNILP
ncbi:UDP-N-acetylmuramate dehydrogenase [Flavobacteriaceae bacterium F08102]|nr:UDP-N-acetylmuramate dehydrogenase [Flavobacteriaceae bacterium F08102]